MWRSIFPGLVPGMFLGLTLNDPSLLQRAIIALLLLSSYLFGALAWSVAVTDWPTPEAGQAAACPAAFAGVDTATPASMI